MSETTTMPLSEFVLWQLQDPTRNPLIVMSNAKAIVTRSKRVGGHVDLYMALSPLDRDEFDLDDQFVITLPYNFEITF